MLYFICISITIILLFTFTQAKLRGSSHSNNFNKRHGCGHDHFQWPISSPETTNYLNYSLQDIHQHSVDQNLLASQRRRVNDNATIPVQGRKPMRIQ